MQKSGILSTTALVTPLEVSKEVLLELHTREYIDKLFSSNLKIVQVGDVKHALTPLVKFKLGQS